MLAVFFLNHFAKCGRRRNMIRAASANVMTAYFQCKESKRVIHHGGGYSLGRTRTHRVSGFVYKLVTSTAKWEDLAHTMPMLLTGL